MKNASAWLALACSLIAAAGCATPAPRQGEWLSYELRAKDEPLSRPR